jgi:membrane associated rhomboid family serine protease
MGLQDDFSARQPIFRAPASVIGLIALLAAAHAARVFAPKPWPDRILDDYALNPLAYLGGDLFHQAVPPFSHMLLHADWTHLAINCAWLLAFGPVVARRFGDTAFLAFFILCGVAGAAAFVALDWGQGVGAIGASGAISGLMGAAIRMMDVANPYLNLTTRPLAPLFSRQVMLFSAVFLVLNLLSGLFGFFLVGPGQSIAWQDHLGGYLAGLLLASLFERYLRPQARFRS